VVVVLEVVVVVTIVLVVGGAVLVVVVATGAVVVVVATGAVVVVVATGAVVVVVATGAVVVVVATGAVVVVVATGTVVVVVAAAQGLGEQLPGPLFVPPRVAQSVSLSRTQSKAPVAEDGTQHWIVVGGVVVVVVAEGAVVVVVLPGGGHEPSAAHASQQLGTDPTHAEPPSGALHLPLRLILHFVWPSESVMQQETTPGRPQVDCSAQPTTTSSHASRSDPASIAASATWSTHST
jgi:hypothetical protein